MNDNISKIINHINFRCAMLGCKLNSFEIAMIIETFINRSNYNPNTENKDLIKCLLEEINNDITKLGENYNKWISSLYIPNFISKVAPRLVLSYLRTKKVMEWEHTGYVLKSRGRIPGMLIEETTHLYFIRQEQ